MVDVSQDCWNNVSLRPCIPHNKRVDKCVPHQLYGHTILRSKKELVFDLNVFLSEIKTINRFIYGIDVF